MKKKKAKKFFFAEAAPPCKAACPVNTDAQRYVSLIAQERYQEALAVIMEHNPFPASIGRICFHPCESNCRRRLVDEPIAICSLKRFVTDKVGDAYQPPPPVAKEEKKVAVIGSGPAGLTAAHDLARLGYQVTVLEAKPEAGGMLRHGILSYRLPKEILNKDINNILAAGIDLRTGVEVGRDVPFNDLREEYDALLIAVGLSSSRKLPLPGADLEGVHYAVPFLESVNYGRPEKLGDEVIVIGGGNVAIDVARSARRLGCKKVRMVCLEGREEMPAHEWEIQAAAAEGVDMHCSLGPHQIVGTDGRVSGLEFKEVDCVFDEQGRFNPRFNEEKRTVIPGDTIIFAIGQAGDLSFLHDSGVGTDERGRLIFDHKTMATSLPGVFAAGEIAAGPGAAISAIATGHRAAKAISAYLSSGTVAEVPRISLTPVAEVPPSVIKLIMKSKRQVMPQRDVGGCPPDFQEVELGFDDDAAGREAQRCLNCTAGASVIKKKCVACLTCVRVCPYGVPEIRGAVAYMDPARCQSCGICAAECPAQAIQVRLTEEAGFRQSVTASLEAMKTTPGPKTIGVTCLYGHIWARDRIVDAEKSAANVRLIRVLCPGRLGANDILSAFEAGADKVFITVCAADYCHFISGNDRISRKVDYLRPLLAAAGFGDDKLEIINIGAETSIKDLVTTAAGGD